jgi:hypothetical protein
VRRANIGNAEMNAPTPHYINELQSDMRGIKEGWYAIEHDGNLAFGPFSSREDCLNATAQPTSRSHNAATAAATAKSMKPRIPH